MTRPVDEKIVKMRIENQDFKLKADETLGIFGRLNEALNKIPGINLGKTVSELGNIKTAVGNVGMGGLAQSVENVSNKFSALDMVTFTVLSNITNRAVDAGFKIGKALTVDGAVAGFQEYELKMGAIQTIMAGSGESLETVNKYLQELNEYSDQTIYSFADMTQNIGKFTNAGVKLDDAVASIKGISNVAARSGANTNEAARAMYNFSQGLSAGFIKLIDWKSIENANMATVEFKQHLIDSAVAAGTLEKKSDGMYKVLSTNNKGQTMPDTISATKNFNDSLQYQWMTSEALIGTLKEYSDETTTIGKASSDAARDVKTFSMLMDTTKEAIQSGWATSSEIMIGDFETAKKRWTQVSEILGEMVGRNADGRNDYLKSLQSAGVFENAWQGLFNILEAVGTITKTISDVFKKVFPTDVSGPKKFSEIFLKFTEALTPSETGLLKIKRALEFVFNIMKAGIGAVKGIVSIFWDLGKALLGLIPDNLFGVIGAIFINVFKLGTAFSSTIDPVSKIRDLIAKLAVKFEAFGEAMEPVVSMIGGKLVAGIRELKRRLGEVDFGKITEQFKALIDKLPKFKMPDLTPFIDKLKSIKDFEMPEFKNPFADLPEINILDKLSGVMDKLASAGAKVRDVLKAIWDGIKGAVGGLSKTKEGFNGMTGEVGDAIGNIGLFEIAGATGIGAAVIILQKVAAFIKDFKKVIDPTSWKEKIDGLFKTLTTGINEFVAQAKYESLKKVATSLLILSGALLILSFLDVDELKYGLATLGAALAGMMGAMALLSKLDFSMLDGGKMMVALIGMGVALSLVAGAMKKLGGIPTDQLIAGGTAVMGILLGMTMAMKVLSKLSSDSMKDQADLTQTIVAMGMIAIVIGMLTKSITKLSKIPEGKLLGSTVAVAALLGIMLGGFAAISALPLKGLTNVEAFVKFAGALGKSAVAIAIFSLSLKVLGEAVEFFGELDMVVLAKGIGAISALLIMFGVMEKISGGKGSFSAGIGLAIIAASLQLLIPPLVLLGLLPLNILTQGLLALSAMLLGLSVAMYIAKDSFKGSVGMAILIGAINLLIPAVVALGTIGSDILIKGILAMAGALTVLVIAARFAQGSIAGAAAIVILAAAMNLLIPPMLALGSLDGESIGSLLIGLGGVMLVLAASVAYFGNKPAMLAITAGGIALLAAALTLLIVPITALGLLPLSVIITALGVLAGVLLIMGGATALLSGLVIPMLGLAGAIFLLGAGVALGGVGLGIFATALVAFAGSLGVAASALILSISLMLDGLTKLMPKIGKAVGAFVTMIAQVIIDNAPIVVTAIVILMVSLLQGMVQFLPKFIEAAVFLLVGFMQGIGQGMPLIVQAAMQMIIDFVAGMRVAIKEQGPYLIKEVLGLTGEILILVVQGIIAALDALIGGFPFVTNALKGLSEDVGTVLRDNFDGETLGLPAGESIPKGVAKGIQNETSLIDEKLSIMNGTTEKGLGALDTNSLGMSQADGYGEGFLSKLPGMDGIGSEFSETLGGGLGSFDFGGQGALNVEDFDLGMNSMMPDLESTGLDMSNLTGGAMGSFDFYGAGTAVPKAFGDGIEDETQYARMKAAGISDVVIEEMGIVVPDKEGKNATKSYADGMTSEKQYLIASARGISDETLAALGLFPATKEGKKKALEFGAGLNSEQKYLKGIAEGLSKDTLAAMGLYPPKDVGKKKTKDLADGITSEQKYAVGSAAKVSDQVLEAMGLYPPTEEGKKKSKALGKGIDSEKQYAIGIAMGLSESVLNAMGLFNPEAKGANKSKAVARGMISEEGTVTKAAKGVAKEARDSMYVDTTSVGRNYDYGVRDGINDKRGVVVAAAEKMARYTIEGMRQEFQEASPSKVGIRSGRFLGMGVAIGIDREAKRTKEAAGRMANNTIKSMNAFIDQFAPSFEKDNEMEVKLTPVMDMDRIPIMPDQKFKAKADLTNANLSVSSIAAPFRQNGDVPNQTVRIDELRKEWETLKASSAKPTSDTYNINITANGDLPQSAIKRMAQQIQIEIKNVNDRDKMSKGGVVNY